MHCILQISKGKLIKCNIVLISCFFITACISKTKLVHGELTGYSGFEIVNSDTCHITFTTDSTFARFGTMYIQSHGFYFITRDTLVMYYFCDSGLDEKNVSLNFHKLNCNKQLFVKTKTHRLKLVSMVTKSGEPIPKPKGHKGIALLYCNSFKISEKYQ